jgi:hypothetical protein
MQWQLFGQVYDTERNLAWTRKGVGFLPRSQLENLFVLLKSNCRRPASIQTVNGRPNRIPKSRLFQTTARTSKIANLTKQKFVSSKTLFSHFIYTIGVIITNQLYMSLFVLNEHGEARQGAIEVLALLPRSQSREASWGIL